MKRSFLFAGILALAGCTGSSTSESSDADAVARDRQALTPVEPGVRRSIHTLSPANRAALASAILDFITQPILTEHAQAHDWHHPSVGELFFSRHHDYLLQLENYLIAHGQSQFLPLPKWDPGTPIPSEFLVVDPLVTQTPLNANPNLPMPAEFRGNNLCSFSDASQLAIAVEDWHDDVHVAVGGAMGNISSAPGAPIFWLWHGFLDDIYHDQNWMCHLLPAYVTSVFSR